MHRVMEAEPNNNFRPHTLEKMLQQQLEHLSNSTTLATVVCESTTCRESPRSRAVKTVWATLETSKKKSAIYHDLPLIGAET